METLNHIHGGNLWAASAGLGVDPKEMLDFSANINPLGPPPGLAAALRDNFDSVIHYPDPDCTRLRAELAGRLNLPVPNIIMGNGAVELIYLLMAALKPKRVLIPEPTFGEYETAVRIAGGKILHFPLSPENCFQPDLDSLCAQLPEVDLAVLCNPNNPTGVLLSADQISQVAREAARHNTFLLVDEAFIDFVGDRERYSLATRVEELPNLFIAYSLTKFLGIPGLRLGAGLANRRLTAALTARKDPWNVNCFAQIAGEVGLANQEYLSAATAFVQSEKDYLFNRLANLPGFRPLPPSVNYILVQLPPGVTAKALQNELGAYKIMVRDCSSFWNLNDSYIRVAVKNRAANDLLVQALEKITKGGGDHD